MRIIAGKFGGRSLASPPGGVTRPAMARTREALFSMLESRGLPWAECRVLDLFAGTGSLAFEALSRGATHATLVESGHEACQCIVKNVQALGIEQECSLVSQDVLRFLRQPAPVQYNLIFIDPPYRANMASRTLQALEKSGFLVPGAVIAAEIETGFMPAVPERYFCCANRQFGQTSLHIWKIL